MQRQARRVGTGLSRLGIRVNLGWVHQVWNRAGSADTEGSWSWWAAHEKIENEKGGPAARELVQPAEF
jgi:hypothetical protein